MHPTEDELIQHLCGEDDATGRARLQAHLDVCAECRLACEEITGALTMVNEAVPEPPDGFERIMWARVQQVIAAEPRLARWSWRQWVPAGALAAATIVAVLAVGRTEAPAPDAGAMQAAARTDDDTRLRDRVLYTALDSHFQQTEMLLVELRNAAEGDTLEFERVSADDLVAAGRLYRQTAEFAGYRNLAQVLDELEPVLVEMARSPEQMNARERAWLRNRIEEDALLFKVRAATNDIRERAIADQ
jgi:hypothetical protein